MTTLTNASELPWLSFDVDDVLFDLNTPWCVAYSAATGHTITPEDVTDWRFSCVPDENRETLYAVRTPTLYEEAVLPMDFAIDGIRLLSKFYRLVAVTSDRPEFVQVKAELISYYFPWIDEIVFANNKFCVNAPLVDDGLHNRPRWLFTRPWNRKYLLEGSERVNSWPELLDRLVPGWWFRFGGTELDS